MGGEMYQICCIAAAAKKTLTAGNTISYIPIKYENRIEFQFLPEKKLFRASNFKADNVAEWFEHCLGKGMEDIKLLAPINTKNRGLLGFSNTSPSSLVCFFKNGKVSYFSPRWQADSLQKTWNILYTEYEWVNAPTEKPDFEDNTKAFKIVLADIEDLARIIECNNFAELFKKAATMLDGMFLNTDKARVVPLPQIPERNLRIFEAANTADVFGAMGSWNDCPPHMAHEKGLDKEYETLSDELLKQIRLAILYAINEW